MATMYDADIINAGYICEEKALATAGKASAPGRNQALCPGEARMTSISRLIIPLQRP
jgi:hypothetical protein